MIFVGGYVWWKVYEKRVVRSTLPLLKHGNQRVQNFREAKKKASLIYHDHPFTFYCHCPFHGKQVALNGCSYSVKVSGKRSRRIEWEHIVPVSLFGKNFPSWFGGHQRCRSSSGQKYRGRKCSRKVSQNFRFMEGDLYNLVPAIGEVNRLRGRRPMGRLLGKDRSFSLCGLQFGSRGPVEPANDLKGFIARTYLYRLFCLLLCRRS